MLASLQLGDGQNLGTADGRIALDCSIRKTRQGHYVVSTTDFFFPLVDSPYLQGRIGAANVLSDLYAEGIPDCDFVLMLLAASRDMPEDQRKICTQHMIQGFRDACSEAETAITGGQTVLNPWPIIGGVATSVVAEGEFIPSDGAKPHDVVILTKPLGTQIAVNVHQWRQTKHFSNSHKVLWETCLQKANMTDDTADQMMHKAVLSMAHLNRIGAQLMIKHKANACTDVTGFGILGHAQNLSENQVEAVGIELHTLPVIAGTPLVNKEVMNFRLLDGYSAETSGGLMVCIPEENAQAFIDEMKELDGRDAWIIGKVVEQADRKSKIVEGFKVLEV